MKVDANLTRYQKVLYYLAKFIGLSSFDVKNNEIRPVTLLGKAHALTLVALMFVWCWYFQRGELQENKTKSTADLVILILISFFGASTFSSLYIFAFKSEKMVDTFHRIIVAERQLKELEAGKIRRENLKFFAAKIIASNILILGTKIFEIAYADQTHWTGIWSIFFWIGLVLPRVLLFLHNVNVIMIFVQTMTRIGKCFESLNEKLWDVLRPYCVTPPSGDSHGSPIFVMGRRLRTGNRDFQEFRISLECVKKLRKLHHELKGLIDSTIDLFKTPIILDIGYLFSKLLVCCYKTYREVVSLTSTPNSTTIYSPILMRTSEMMIVIFEVMIIAHACSSTCNAGNVTKIVIHKVWNKFHPEALRGQVFMFTVQLLHNPVAASAFGFFDLGYAYIQEMFSAIVAYLVIMIQVDASSRKIAARE